MRLDAIKCARCAGVGAGALFWGPPPPSSGRGAVCYGTLSHMSHGPAGQDSRPSHAVSMANCGAPLLRAACSFAILRSHRPALQQVSRAPCSAKRGTFAGKTASASCVNDVLCGGTRPVCRQSSDDLVRIRAKACDTAAREHNMDSCCLLYSPTLLGLRAARRALSGHVRAA